MQSPLKHNMDTKLSGLRLQSYLLAELNQLGYEVVGDMQYLPQLKSCGYLGWAGTAIGRLQRHRGVNHSLP